MVQNINVIAIDLNSPLDLYRGNGGAIEEVFLTEIREDWCIFRF